SPALLVDLGSVPVRPHSQEALWLATLSDTASRHENLGPPQGLTTTERLVPHLLDQPVDQPPALTWFQLMSLELRFKPPQTPQDLLMTARRFSFAMALLTIACIVWVGHSIAGHRMALLAGLVAATNPALVYFGRQATP